jgi:hypothetical protein
LRQAYRFLPGGIQDEKFRAGKFPLAGNDPPGRVLSHTLAEASRALVFAAWFFMERARARGKTAARHIHAA